MIHLKRFIGFLAALILPAAVHAVSVNDVKVSQATNGSPPAYADRFITPSPGTLWGFDSTNKPIKVTLGANLSYDQTLNVLNASGSLSAVAWGSITGLISAQTDLVAALAGKVSTTVTVNGHALSSNVTVSKSDVGLGNVENTALSTWAGSTSLTTVGTIGAGVWNGTAIANGEIASALTGKTYNGLTITSSTGTLTIAAGKTLTSSNTLTFAGTDGNALNIGPGGTLGTAAFTAATAYEVPLTFSTGLTRATNTITVNAVQAITRISGLTTNGFVKTGSSNGTLSVDTNTYISAVSPTITTPTFVTNITLPSSSITTSAIGQTAFAASAWATGHGAIQVYDGTGATWLIGVPSASTPSAGQVPTFNSDGSITFQSQTGAPTGATYITQTPDSTLSAEQALSTLNTGLVKNTTATGVLTIVADSTGLRGVISDPTGTGALVFANTPTLITPILGVAAATSINKLTITAPATGSTFTLADGKTFTVSNTITFTGTDSTSFALPGTSQTLASLAGTETLTNKTLTAPVIVGGTANALTSLGFRSTGASFDVLLASSEVLTATRTINWVLGDSSRTLTLGGVITTTGDLITAGGNSLTLTTSGSTNVTFPTTGTLSTLAGTESLSNKTIVSPIISTSIVLPTGTSPTTSAIGNVAFRTNAWTTAHGTLQLYDGTANAYVVATQGTSTPSNGQSPVYNTDGTITWQTPAGGGTVTHTLGALTGSALIIGNGGADVAALSSLGTTTTVLHGNASGSPTFGAVSLTSDVSGTLGPTAGGTGVTSFTAYSPIFGGTTSTGALQTTTLGTSGWVLTSNGPGAIATFQAAASGGTVANPTGTVGLTAVNGTATSAIRSDGAPALSQSIVPTWTGIHTFSSQAVLSAGASFNGGGTIGAGVSGGVTLTSASNANIFFTPNGTGQIQIGTASSAAPTGILNIYGNSDATTVFEERRAAADTFGGGFSGTKARGTIASPTATNSGDVLSNFWGGGFGTVWNEFAGRMAFQAGALWSVSDNSTKIVWSVTPVGSTSRADKMLLTPAGFLVVNSVTDDGANALQVTGNVVTTGVYNLPGGGNLAGVSGGLTLQGAGTNQPVNIKPSGTGFIYAGAGTNNTSAFSVYNSFIYPFAKTDVTLRSAFFIGSNDTNPFGINFAFTGNATAASRILQISLGNIGLDSAGRFQMAMDKIEVMGTSGSVVGGSFSATPAGGTVTAFAITAEASNASLTLTANGTGIVKAVSAFTASTSLTVGTTNAGVMTSHRFGTSGAMTAGAVTVTDSGCTTSSLYFFTTHTLGTVTVASAFRVSSRTAGTSFVITSSVPTDTSTVDWEAIN